MITEGWCGDAAQILPFINKISELNEKIELKLVLRDQHPEVMDEFLTDGSRSIPKVVVLNKENLDVLGDEPFYARALWRIEPDLMRPGCNDFPVAPSRPFIV